MVSRITDENGENAGPFYAESTSTVYMCGHHSYAIFLDGHRGNATIACGQDDAERLVRWLNRCWREAYPD